jgi:hypothetical protein
MFPKCLVDRRRIGGLFLLPEALAPSAWAMTGVPPVPFDELWKDPSVNSGCKVLLVRAAFFTIVSVSSVGGQSKGIVQGELELYQAKSCE